MKGMFVAALLSCSGFMSAHAQKGASIIDEYSGVNYASLNARQRSNYNIIAANPNVKEIKLIRLKDLSKVQDSGEVVVDLPFLPCRNIAFHVKTVDYTSDGAYQWYGEAMRNGEEDSLCSSGFLTLVHYAGKGGLMGSISLNGFDAELQDLGDGIKAVAIMDSDRLSKLVCGQEEGEGTSGAKPTGPEDEDDCLKREIKVLVLYTPKAKAAVTFSLLGGIWQSNMWLHANTAVFKANTVMNNSQVGKNIVLAGVEEIPGYEEATLSKSDANNIAVNPTAQILRNQYKADVVMLMVKPQAYGSSIFGNTREIGSYNPNTNQVDAAYAYGVVDAGTAISQLTFPHELGHLLGARHSIGEDAVTNLPFLDPNAHGKKFTKWWGPFIVGRYRTTVTNPATGDRRTLIPYYSNPNVYYDGKPTGTTEANNTQRIKAHYPIIGSFYTETVPFVNGIQVNNIPYPPAPQGMKNICDYYIRVTAQVNACGKGPYTHTWSISYDGIYWYDPGPGITQDIYISGIGTVLVKLTTWSAFSGTAITTQNINYNCKRNNNVEPFSSHQSMPVTQEAMIYPNPGNGTFTLRYIAMAAEPVEIALWDIAGRKLETLYSGQSSKGANLVQLTAGAKPAAGTYLVVIKGASINKCIKLAIQ